MPNFDAGHYFLTVLAPLRTDLWVDADGATQSRRHALKTLLDQIPTAERTVASKDTAPSNPFAGIGRTHFARFALLEDVVFNGRVSGDSLLARIAGVDPMVPQKVDRLASPFLALVCDFDAASGDADELRGFAAEMWDQMRAELAAVFQHCVGFDKVSDAGSFFDYIRKCQIETTMPFNDYWSAAPDLKTFSLTPYLVVAAAALLAFVIGLWPGLHWLILLAGVILAAALYFGVRGLFAFAAEPFPRSPQPAPASDLGTVLKALYVQRSFRKFVVDAQAIQTSIQAGHLGDAALRDAFGVFLADNRPNDPTPSQPPGIIGS